MANWKLRVSTVNYCSFGRRTTDAMSYVCGLNTSQRLLKIVWYNKLSLCHMSHIRSHFSSTGTYEKKKKKTRKTESRSLKMMIKFSQCRHRDYLFAENVPVDPPNWTELLGNVRCSSNTARTIALFSKRTQLVRRFIFEYFIHHLRQRDW